MAGVRNQSGNSLGLLREEVMESGLAESLARSDNHKYKLFQKDT